MNACAIAMDIQSFCDSHCLDIAQLQMKAICRTSDFHPKSLRSVQNLSSEHIFGTSHTDFKLIRVGCSCHIFKTSVVPNMPHLVDNNYCRRDVKV